MGRFFMAAGGTLVGLALSIDDPLSGAIVVLAGAFLVLGGVAVDDMARQNREVR